MLTLSSFFNLSTWDQMNRYLGVLGREINGRIREGLYVLKKRVSNRHEMEEIIHLVLGNFMVHLLGISDLKIFLT